jgi:glutathione S-transferase
VQYLADRKPESKLAPENGTLDRYRLQETLGFINSEIHKTYSPIFSSSTPAETRRDREEYLKKRYAIIEKQLDGRPFLLGATFTAADAYLFTVTRWAEFLKIDLSAFPNLQAFQRRVADRPRVQEALKAEGIGK